MNDALRRVAVAARAVAWQVVLRRPTLGLRTAGAVGALAALRADSLRAPSAAKIRAMLGPLPPHAIRRIRRALASAQWRNDALCYLLERRGVAPLMPLVTTVHAEPLRRLCQARVPVVIAGWHQGPRHATSVALQQLGMPAVVAMLDSPERLRLDTDGVRHVSVIGRAAEVRFLTHAHRALAEGTVAVVHLDCTEDGETVTLLGRRVIFGRGAAALARLSGARVVPVTRRFLDFGWRMEVTFHEPVADADLDRASGAAFERALLGRIAETLDAAARRHPESLRAYRIDWLLSAPGDGSTPGEPIAAARLGRRALRRRQQRRAENQRSWEQQWADAAFKPGWVDRGVSPEIEEAVAAGWFVPGSRSLDAGCGEGDVAAWLAARGFPAVGIDIAESVIARARQRYADRCGGTLRFVCADLCEAPAQGGPFGVLVDRGCFLQLAPDERREYAVHLATACAPDARLLVFGRAFRDGIAFGDPIEIQRRRIEIQLAFEPEFVIERAAPTYLDRYHGERAEERLPGMVFWLRRRGQ